MSLGPDYLVVADLDRDEMEVESGVTMTKVRWSGMNKGSEGMTGEQAAREDRENPTTEEQEVLAELLDAETRDVLNEVGTEMDMRKKRPTDMRNNRSVMMPPPGSALLEAERNTRVGAWRKAFSDYKASNCDEKGSQVKKNLTLDQQLGLKSLSRKVARMELLVLEADKGKQFVVVDEETFCLFSTFVF